MKEVTCKLFKFEELSDDVRKGIVDKKCFDVAYSVMECYSSEYEATLEKFEELMGINVYDWSVDYCTYHSRFRFKDEGPLMGSWVGKELYAEEITGKLLRRYLNNNFMPYALGRKKYYKYEAGYDCERHRWNKQRYSKILWNSWDNCPLTGVCYDYEIMEPIVKCLSKQIPDTYSLRDLVGDVLDNFFGAWHKEYEYWCDNKDNCIEEELTNRYEGEYFFEDGRRFDGIFEDAA